MTGKLLNGMLNNNTNSLNMLCVFFSDNNTCPPGWFASDADWCISVNQGTAQWFDAQTFCSYSGANLASITSLEEFQAIYGKQGST